jgi:hypothetical protein
MPQILTRESWAFSLSVDWYYWCIFAQGWLKIATVISQSGVAIHPEILLLTESTKRSEMPD